MIVTEKEEREKKYKENNKKRARKIGG